MRSAFRPGRRRDVVHCHFFLSQVMPGNTPLTQSQSSSLWASVTSMGGAPCMAARLAAGASGSGSPAASSSSASDCLAMRVASSSAVECLPGCASCRPAVGRARASARFCVVVLLRLRVALDWRGPPRHTARRVSSVVSSGRSTHRGPLHTGVPAPSSLTQCRSPGWQARHQGSSGWLVGVLRATSTRCCSRLRQARKGVRAERCSVSPPTSTLHRCTRRTLSKRKPVNVAAAKLCCTSSCDLARLLPPAVFVPRFPRAGVLADLLGMEKFACRACRVMSSGRDHGSGPTLCVGGEAGRWWGLSRTWAAGSTHQTGSGQPSGC